MFLTEDQSAARLNHENNLANLMNRISGNSNSVKKHDPEKIEETPVSNEEFKDSQDLQESLTPQVIEIPKKHLGQRGPEIPRETRNEIALRSRLHENQHKLADEYDITPAGVNNIKNGRVKGIDEAQVEKQLSHVRDKALERLMESLNLITSEKLTKCSARDLSNIAANMGKVVDKTLPRSNTSDNISLIIYAPEVRSEKSFKVHEI